MKEFKIPSSPFFFFGIFQDPKGAQVFTFVSEKVQIGVDQGSPNREYKGRRKERK